MSTSPAGAMHGKYLVQDINHFSQTSLYSISTIVPFPTSKYVDIGAELIHKDMLDKLGRVVIQQVAEGIYNLCDCRRKERVLFWQLL